jgi:Gram-negative bacterial TonB protein C-terminal
LTRLSRHILSLLVLAGLVVPACAANKEAPHDLLVKSFQQANLWTQGPVKLTAKVRLPKPDGSGDINLLYAVSWAGPDKWRAEWTAGGLDQTTVLNAGKLSYLSTQPGAMVPLLQMESAIEALDGGNPAGPYTLPPIGADKAKIISSKKKVGSVDAKCMGLGEPLQNFCVDPANSQLLTVDNSIENVNFGSFEYSDYTTAGGTTYPQTIKVNYAGKLLEEAKLSVSHDEKFADSVFAAPDKSTAIDWPSCADISKNFSAPGVSKSVPAKMPEAARKAKKYGLVWVFTKVGKDGAVTKATSIGGDPDLIAAASDAVQQYKFTPYLRCGQAVDFQTVVIVPFAPMKMPDEQPIEH